MKYFLTLLLSLLAITTSHAAVGGGIVGGSGGSSSSSGSMSVFTQPGFLFVRTNGNDSTAMINREDMAWRTISNAFRRVTNNCLIVDIGAGNFLAPGNWDFGYTNWNSFAAPMVRLTNILVRGAGPGLTTIYTTNMGGVFMYSNCVGITFEKFTLQGVRTNTGRVNINGLQLAITQRGTNQNIAYRNMVFRDWQDHAIGQAGETCYSSVWLVDNCQFYNIGYTNLDYANGLGVPTYDGAAIPNPGAYVTVRDSYFENCVRGVEFQGAAGLPNGMGNNTVRDCVFRNTYSEGIMLQPENNGQWTNYTNYKITGNHSIAGTNTQSYSPFIIVSGGQNIDISHNVIKGGGANNIHVDPFTACKVRTVNISHNIIEGVIGTAAGAAIYAVDNGVSEDVSIVRNKISRVSFSGVYISGSGQFVDENTITDFSLYDGLQPAIKVWAGGDLASTNIFIRKNTIRNSPTNTTGLDGINIVAGSQNVFLSENVFQKLSGSALIGQAPTAVWTTNVTLP